MRVLLSTIGSRGDVQPLVALATRLREMGTDVRLCVPPDFREWIAGLGFEVVPIGPELRTTVPTPKLAMETVATQFETITRAARGCDAIVGATALQLAARSIAEHMRVPYVFVAYCPAVIPSPNHPPPGAPSSADARELWAKDARLFDDMFGASLDEHRASLGLAEAGGVRAHVLTERPWLACDPTLAPWSDADTNVVQTGAWLLPDETPLSPDIERFLERGAPPVYFGFGSMRGLPNAGELALAAARAVGRRAIVSRGWADLAITTGGDDCLVIDEVNHEALFGRVAAVVHHGGAGTTTAAALAGAPQVVVPQMYDQHYWAKRVRELGIGSAHAPAPPFFTSESLANALRAALAPDVARRASSMAKEIRRDGAQLAAQRLVETIRTPS